MRRLVGGRATGEALVSKQPINFLGMVEPDTGIVRDASHDLFGRTVGGTVLAFPHGIGSSVGAYTIHSIKYSGAAPVAMLCGRPDLTVASGCALANIPLAVLDDGEMASLSSGIVVTVDTDAGTIRRAAG